MRNKKLRIFAGFVFFRIEKNITQQHPLKDSEERKKIIWEIVDSNMKIYSSSSNSVEKKLGRLRRKYGKEKINYILL